MTISRRPPVHPVCHQIRYCFGDTVVGHKDEIDIAVLRQHFRREVIGRADRRNRDAHGIRLLLGEFDNIGDVFGWKARRCDEQHFRPNQHRYRHEIAFIVESRIGQQCRVDDLVRAGDPLRLWPSGSAFATIPAAMLPPAPGRSSTTTGTPMDAAR